MLATHLKFWPNIFGNIAPFLSATDMSGCTYVGIDTKKLHLLIEIGANFSERTQIYFVEYFWRKAKISAVASLLIIKQALPLTTKQPHTHTPHHNMGCPDGRQGSYSDDSKNHNYTKINLKTDRKNYRGSSNPSAASGHA
jgi:hypothetical protein